MNNSYGSTEGGGIALNGEIIEGVEIKISEDNELFIKSPMMFCGYFNNE